MPLFIRFSSMFISRSSRAARDTDAHIKKHMIIFWLIETIIKLCSKSESIAFVEAIVALSQRDRSKQIRVLFNGSSLLRATIDATLVMPSSLLTVLLSFVTHFQLYSALHFVRCALSNLRYLTAYTSLVRSIITVRPNALLIAKKTRVTAIWRAATKTIQQI